jgi:hypothetical protein
MTTLSNNYSAATALTFVLASLADDAWRASTAVDNSSTLYLDALVGGVFTSGTTPVADGSLDLYLYAAIDATRYTGGASGTDGVYTADGEQFLFFDMASVVVDATTLTDYVWGPFSVREIIGEVPTKWGVVAHNQTGEVLHTTATVTSFYGIKRTSA